MSRGDRLREGLLAAGVIAFVRFFARVSPIVSREVARLSERLLAAGVVAFERIFTGVGPFHWYFGISNRIDWQNIYSI